jgi:hypothetical protein
VGDAMTRTGRRMQRRSNAQLYLASHLDRLTASTPPPALAPLSVSRPPHGVTADKTASRRVVAEPLAGGCRLYRLPRAAR